MKYALILLSLLILGCSTPKKVMKNCKKVGDIVWECEDL